MSQNNIWFFCYLVQSCNQWYKTIDQLDHFQCFYIPLLLYIIASIMHFVWCIFILYKCVVIYRIVASTNTCYYSENQIFCFLKSRIVTCQFFLGKNLFLCVVRTLRYRTTFIFWRPMLLIELVSINNMGRH